MEAKPYKELSDSELLALCCWREARGEPLDAKIAQCWSVKNRVLKPSWYNDFKGFSEELGDPHALTLWQRTVLKPWQYSSFNSNDTNSEKWPETGSESEEQCLQIAESVINDTLSDPTNGATSYYDVSIGFPKAWGSEAEWENTLDIGHFRFWRLKTPADLSAEGDV